MIDWINAELLPPGCLDGCPALTFTDTVDTKTGELGDWRTAQHGPFKVMVHNRTRRTELRGSLHKYWSGGHNGGAFCRWEVGQAVERLADELGFEPAQAVLHGLEFGANVPMPGHAKGLLRRAVLHGTEPMDINQYGGRGCKLEAEHQRYYFKLYDKELQLTDVGYEAPGPLLRVELKARKMEFLSKAQLRTLADLSNPTVLEVMGELLLAHLGKVMFAPSGPLPKTLSQQQRELLREGANRNYWTERQLPRPKLRAEMKEYRKLVKKHTNDYMLDAAAKGLRSVWQHLLAAPAPVQVLASPPALAPAQINPLGRVLPLAPFKEKDDDAIHRRAEGLTQALAPATGLDGVLVGAEAPPPPAARFCPTCGRPLTTATKFCSERELGPAAKRCRNAASNPRNNARRRLLRAEGLGTLFDVRPFVRGPEPLRQFVLAPAAPPANARPAAAA